MKLLILDETSAVNPEEIIAIYPVPITMSDPKGINLPGSIVELKGGHKFYSELSASQLIEKATKL